MILSVHNMVHMENLYLAHVVKHAPNSYVHLRDVIFEVYGDNNVISHS